jgi:hypothetical protein
MFKFKSLINKTITLLTFFAIITSSFSILPVRAVECTKKQDIETVNACIKAESVKNGTDKTLISNFCGEIEGDDNLKNIAEFAGCVAASLAFIILVGAIVFMVYGAWIILSDPDKGNERGRKIIFSAVIAMVVSVLSFSLAALVTSVLAGSTK